jgi:hypothetical protein
VLIPETPPSFPEDSKPLAAVCAAVAAGRRNIRLRTIRRSSSYFLLDRRGLRKYIFGLVSNMFVR